jgi:electron transfer flavoprotein beta subunit
MRIAVCVKHVPDGRLRVEPETLRVDRKGSGELNGVDRNAIEEAVRLKESMGDTDVVALSVGPPEATESLRTALALGADRALLISDPAIAGSDLLATAKVLAKALERVDADLVLFGQQTRDGAGGVLWVAVAELLQRPVASQAAEVVLAEGNVRITRQTEFGDEVIEAPLPALVGVTDAINEPRYTSLKGVMGAKKKPLDVLALADLGLDPDDVGAAGSRTEVLAVREPPARPAGSRIEDDGRAAEAIVDFLVEKQLV